MEGRPWLPGHWPGTPSAVSYLQHAHTHTHMHARTHTILGTCLHLSLLFNVGLMFVELQKTVLAAQTLAPTHSQRHALS